MAESIVQVAPDSTGKKLHTNSYTVGANTVEDEFVVLGPYPYATYTVYANAVSSVTAASHVMQLMAGGSLKVRIQRITIMENVAGVATGGSFRLEIVRLTTAGTGGTAITARPYDSSDSAAGAAGMTLPSAKGTEGVFLGALPIGNYTAVGVLPKNEWLNRPSSKPIIIPAGTTNGIALKASGLAATTIDVEIEFTETAF